MMIKSKVFKLILLFVALCSAVFYCSQIRSQYQVMTGETMNTNYRISIRSQKEDTLLHNEVRNELQQINSEMSVFEGMSDLSQFNKSTETGWIDVPEDLSKLLKASYKIYSQTNGYFDPSVGKLVDLWGFGSAKTYKIPSDDEVKEAKKVVGFNKISFSQDFRKARKSNPALTLNLSAIAKGYAVDRIAKLLEKNGYKDFFVEIGGEITARGNRGKKDKGWNIGVARPDNSKNEVYEYIIKLKNSSVATSGDYRNYFYVDGKRYSHTIDPKTGYPVEHDLASVTVFADSCMNADALATGIMSMGEVKGLEFANNNRLAVVMFVRNDDGFQVVLSNEAKKLIKQQSIQEQSAESQSK